MLPPVLDRTYTEAVKADGVAGLMPRPLLELDSSPHRLSVCRSACPSASVKA